MCPRPCIEVTVQKTKHKNQGYKQTLLLCHHENSYRGTSCKETRCPTPLLHSECPEMLLWPKVVTPCDALNGKVSAYCVPQEFPQCAGRSHSVHVRLLHPDSRAHLQTGKFAHLQDVGPKLGHVTQGCCPQIWALEAPGVAGTWPRGTTAPVTSVNDSKAKSICQRCSKDDVCL